MPRRTVPNARYGLCVPTQEDPEKPCIPRSFRDMALRLTPCSPPEAKWTD